MMKRCPSCALYVRRDAVKCHHCGAYLSRSLEGMTHPDPAVAPYRPPAPPADRNVDRFSRQRRMVRGVVTLFAIAAILTLTWTEERRRNDPAANPISATFEAFEQTFGPASALTLEQKDLEFEKYKGRYVRWEGAIVYLNVASESEQHISLRHGVETTASTSDVTLYVRPQDRNKLSTLRVGDRLVYVGSLVDYGRDGGPITIQDGRIIK